jgi:V/A-type H+-transporting ATPase subunit B
MELSGFIRPIAVLPSLSRLMKDGIGKDATREDHPEVSNQLFSSYSRVQEARSLASVIGEDELSEIDKSYMKFGREFEKEVYQKGFGGNRTLDQTLDLGGSCCPSCPGRELDRVDDVVLKRHLKVWQQLDVEMR